MTPPPPESSTEKASESKASATDGDQSKSEQQETATATAAAATASRENFLRRLEQQQAQLKSPPEENKKAPEYNDNAPEKKAAINNDKATKPAVKNKEVTKPQPEKEVTTNNQKQKSATNNTNGSKAAAAAASVTRPPSQQKLPVGDELLLNYLSNYCQLTGNTNNNNDTSTKDSSPCDWIQNVDPSSLVYLRGLANVNDIIQNPDFTTVGRLKSEMPSRCDSNASMNTTSNTTAAAANKNKGTMYEIIVPSNAIPGEAFALKAGGAKVMVMCPKNANVGQRIRFHIPPTPPVEKPPPLPHVESNAAANKENDELRQVGQQVNVQNNVAGVGASYPNVPLENNASGAAAAAAAGKKEDGETTRRATSPKPWQATKPSPNSNSGNTDNMPPQDIQHRMLSIIENQQVQMFEMQTRLDALCGMMARMEMDVRYLRNGNRGEGGRQRGYRMLGGLFGGGGAGTGGQAGAVEQAGGQAGFGAWQGQQGGQGPWQDQQGMGPGVPGQQWQQPQGLPEQQREMPPREVLPEAESQNNENLPEAHQHHAVPRTQRQQGRRPQNQRARQPPQQQQPQPRLVPNLLAPRHEQVILLPQNQGIFFPLFLMLFRFLVSLPGRLRTLLLTTGVGRVYNHLRERAIERRAFAHVDLASIMKLLVMLIIFSGRVGDTGGGNGNGNAARNNRRRAGEEEEFGIMAHAYSILQSVIDYWNGHRVHTLILASFIAFLIQVGLLKFLYEVLWVERGELLRAYLGQDGGEDGDDDLAPGDDGHEVNNGGDALQGGGDLGNGGVNNPPARQVGGRDQHPAGNDPAAAPAAPIGGMIRRGPNNGGFLHDVQCLILSFLLSLIPAWKPEEAAQEVEPQQQQAEEANQDQPELAEQPAAPVRGGRG
mmetsp:Transcript_23916/g.51653  ORF Transcript_23916/g.51653 Transcript_23916/m.51653 type:complete len:883 (-) Transcript_23916:139-2787(-)